MTSYCQYTPDKKEQSTQNQTKICAIIVFYVYFVLYIELLFGDVGLNGSLKKLTIYSQTVTGTTSFDASLYTGLSCNSVIVLNAYTNDSNGGIEVAIVSVEDETYYARCYDKSNGYLTDKKITIHIDYILRRME